MDKRVNKNKRIKRQRKHIAESSEEIWEDTIQETGCTKKKSKEETIDQEFIKTTLPIGIEDDNTNYTTLNASLNCNKKKSSSSFASQLSAHSHEMDGNHEKSPVVCNVSMSIDDQIFACSAPQCGNTFTTEARLKKHYESEHPTVSIFSYYTLLI
ncbi:hypothetical protein RFI_23053 [Reticulomyxa filosa]|uniref:C2H2-type domain-containing protein n=1 Tax=Reticulomyxa filosa TaxID=46433 RepID=X6MML1_RETFI|nr:hypothetical protein RFI_23053 [Reticulomyxa filosa]|eukprot:ETO14320.1 hypothetical protein RFI_23053 [Reticulomyxa filosa]